MGEIPYYTDYMAKEFAKEPNDSPRKAYALKHFNSRWFINYIRKYNELVRKHNEMKGKIDDK